MSMSQFTANDGPKPQIKWDGKVYDVSFFCPEMLTFIEQEIVNQAITRLDKLKIYPEHKERYNKELFAALDAGGFSPGGDRWESVMRGKYGGVLVLWACIFDNHRDITVDEAGKMATSNQDDVKAALAIVLPDFFKVRGMMENLPPEKMLELMEKVQKEYGRYLK